MTKIKLSLPSGSEVEKTVLSYFNNGGNYLVLDAESVGSMGLPIILVSKVTDKVEKIADQTEWQQVKGYLKNIISGGQTSYLSIPDSIAADEVYYTQLTLPVASFDALKNNYKAPDVASVSEPVVSADNVTPVADSVSQPVVQTPQSDVQVSNEETPVIPSAPTNEENNIPVIENSPIIEPNPTMTAPTSDMQPVNMSTEVPIEEVPVIDPVAPVENGTVPTVEAPIVNEGVASSEPSTPVEEVPAVSDVPIMQEPALPTIEENSQNAGPVINDSTSIVGQNEVENQTANVSEIKQRFMKACEDLFDALSSLK